MALSSTEIKAIECGVPNVNYQNISGLQSRVLQTFWEIDMYKSTGDANGHSLTQRFEYWIASWNIIKNNLLFGVGTGDLEQELFKQYDQMNSKLSIEYRLHPHNQFLSIMLCFGVIGLIWFLYSLFYPMFAYKKYSDYLYVAFIVIAVCSFFTEDTLETQAGVTFYAFLNSFLLFVDRDKQGNTIE
jgi:O-antigen ligase